MKDQHNFGVTLKPGLIVTRNECTLNIRISMTPVFFRYTI